MTIRADHQHRMTKFSLLCLAGLIALSGPAPALAQDGAALEEILVTATRRAETDIQTTPVAVTAVSQVEVERVIPRDLGDLLSYAPNVSNGKQPGFKSANFAIRGVGQNGIILYFENQVGVTVDDFVIPHIQTANIEMLDIASVEILRGPQGTLFGKNTTGGVVNVKTNRPEMGVNNLNVRAQVAEYGRLEGAVVANFAWGEDFAFRAAGLWMESDGFYERGAEYGPVVDLWGADPDNTREVDYPHTGATGVGDGKDVGGDDLFSGRFKLRWQPSDGIDVNVAYEVVRDQGDSPPSVNGTPPGTGYLWNALGFTQDSGDPLKRAASTGRDVPFLEMSRGHEIDVDGYYLNLDMDLGGDHTLTVFAGNRQTESWLPSTYTGEVGPVSLFDATRQDERDTSQFEARVASDLDGPLNWVGGFFYQEDDTDFTVAQFLGFVDFVNLDSHATFGSATFFNDNPQVLANSQEAESWAIYADVTYEIDARWTLGVGLRYTEEEKAWTGRHQMFVQLLGGMFDPELTWQDLGEPLAATDYERWPTGVVRDDEKWEEPTWRLTLGHQANDDLYAYFTYARGFKSGGYNDQTGTGGNPIPAAAARPTDPETADSFELGMRSEWLDNTLRLNLTGFYVVYDDSQQQLNVTIETDRDMDGEISMTERFQETRFFNAAEVTAMGLEVEATLLVSDNLSVRGSLGWLDAEFDEFQADANFDGTIGVGEDLSGRDVARAPEWTANVDFLYSHPAGGGGSMDYVLNLNYEDEAVYAHTAVGDAPDGLTDDRTLVNFSATYRASNGWWVRAFGKNITDEEYRIGELPVATLWVMSFYGQPRTFGLEAGMDFDW